MIKTALWSVAAIFIAIMIYVVDILVLYGLEVLDEKTTSVRGKQTVKVLKAIAVTILLSYPWIILGIIEGKMILAICIGSVTTLVAWIIYKRKLQRQEKVFHS